ncbi:hypothetical protein [Stenotrophomonas sp. PD6]|uniref:hypothetical protein n=1 Tax=Stenotrophomonas sp. PD6 TaxID=3368612 RepID=UPI003BA01350
MSRSSNPSDKGVESQLSSYSIVAYQAKRVASELHAEGLGLLNHAFGGRVGDEDETACLLKDELLRERYGNWRVHRGGELWEMLGYRSALLEKVTSELGITIAQLRGRDRDARAEDVIASQSWGAEFTVAKMLGLQSPELSRLTAEERKAEAGALSLTPEPIPDTSGVRRIYASLLRQLGYRKLNMPGNGATLFHRGPQGRLVVALRVNALPGHVSTVSMGAMPRLDLSGCSDELRRGFDSGAYIDIVEPIIQGFGRYRSAGSDLEFALQIRAYEMFIDKLLPLLEDAVPVRQ